MFQKVLEYAGGTPRKLGIPGEAELAGKVGLIMLSLPLFQKIAELAVSLMNGKAVG